MSAINSGRADRNEYTRAFSISQRCPLKVDGDYSDSAVFHLLVA